MSANSSGNVSWSYTSSCSDAVGTYYWYAKDVSTAQDSSQVKMVIRSNSSCGGGDVPLTSGVVCNSSVSQGQWKYFYIDVPSEAVKLEIKIMNLTKESNATETESIDEASQTSFGDEAVAQDPLHSENGSVKLIQVYENKRK